MNKGAPFGKTTAALSALANRVPTMNVRTGILEQDGSTEHEGSDLTLAELGAVLEYGTADGHIPPRPAYEDAGDKHRKEWQGLMNKAVSEVVDQAWRGQSPSMPPSMRVLGVKMRADVRREIPYWDVPNAESTIERKGSDAPMIDTAEYANSIRSQAEDGPRREVVG